MKNLTLLLLIATALAFGAVMPRDDGTGLNSENASGNGPDPAETPPESDGTEVVRMNVLEMEEPLTTFDQYIQLYAVERAQQPTVVEYLSDTGQHSIAVRMTAHDLGGRPVRFDSSGRTSRSEKAIYWARVRSGPDHVRCIFTKQVGDYPLRWFSYKDHLEAHTSPLLGVDQLICSSLRSTVQKVVELLDRS